MHLLCWCRKVGIQNIKATLNEMLDDYYRVVILSKHPLDVAGRRLSSFTINNSKFELQYQPSIFNINEQVKWIRNIYTWHGLYFYSIWYQNITYTGLFKVSLMIVLKVEDNIYCICMMLPEGDKFISLWLFASTWSSIEYWMWSL